VSPASGHATLVVTSPVAPLHAEPRAGSEQVSQRVAGHTVVVLEGSDPWLRVRGADAYEGWMHHGYLRELRPGDERRYAAGRVSLGCTVRERDGCRRLLPLGAILADDATVEAGVALAPEELRARFPRTGEAVARSAVELFEGTPYQWGGITPWGADCSGLVQTCFGLHGVPMPRDSRQQAELGRGVDGELAALRAADLLFFSDRPGGTAITHVGVALGGMRMVHLALGRGGYAVESLDRRGDPYVAALVERYRFSRRLEL
jgi:hypothetical protein